MTADELVALPYVVAYAHDVALESLDPYDELDELDLGDDRAVVSWAIRRYDGGAAGLEADAWYAYAVGLADRDDERAAGLEARAAYLHGQGCTLVAATMRDHARAIRHGQ